MSIQVQINIAKEAIEKKLKEIENRYIRFFAYIGETAVNHAKSNGTYKDRTANLRNSIGYVVLLNGEIKRKSNISGLNQSTVDSVKGRYPQGVVLVVVAGMKYAVYVERKGYDVLSGAELLAEQLLANLTNQI